ncbi:MAG: hypothetical protein D8M61_20960, partial [Ignavibacteriae bacterium]|nr:hypothetical protein [Ignavibacteriota bacterium]
MQRVVVAGGGTGGSTDVLHLVVADPDAVAVVIDRVIGDAVHRVRLDPGRSAAGGVAGGADRGTVVGAPLEAVVHDHEVVADDTDHVAIEEVAETVLLHLGSVAGAEDAVGVLVVEPAHLVLVDGTVVADDLDTVGRFTAAAHVAHAVLLDQRAVAVDTYAEGVGVRSCIASTQLVAGDDGIVARHVDRGQAAVVVVQGVNHVLVDHRPLAGDMDAVGDVVVDRHQLVAADLRVVAVAGIDDLAVEIAVHDLVLLDLRRAGIVDVDGHVVLAAVHDVLHHLGCSAALGVDVDPGVVVVHHLVLGDRGVRAVDLDGEVAALKVVEVIALDPGTGTVHPDPIGAAAELAAGHLGIVAGDRNRPQAVLELDVLDHHIVRGAGQLSRLGAADEPVPDRPL